MRARRRQSRGYALPAVMFFLVFAFGAWAVLFRSSSSIIRTEQARVYRDTRSVFTAPAVAQGLRLLQTGNPPADPYECKLTLTDGGQTRYFLLTFERISPSRWDLFAAPTDALDPTPEAPATFFTVPAAPSSLAAATVSNAQIDLAWADVPFDNGYRIERSLDGSTGWSEIATVDKNVTTYSSIGLSANTTYYYRVRGTNAAGLGEYSNVASDITKQVPPFDPSGLGALTVSSTQIDLVWTDNSSTESGFKVERSANGSTGWTQIGIADPDATGYSDTGLTPDTTWYYRIRAFNFVGNSGYSNDASAATFPLAPDAPTALAMNTVSQTQIDLTWEDNSANEVEFKIERSPDNSTWTQIATTGSNVASYSDTGLSAATTYYYRVSAANPGGDSTYSNTISGATLPNPPAAADGLATTTLTSSEVALTWTDNSSDEIGFRIERSDNGVSGWTEIATVGADVAAYEDSSGLSANTTYYYRVRAYNTGGTSTYTAVVSGSTNNKPAAPSNLIAVVASATSIQLSWTDNSNNETGFRVHRSLNGVTAWNSLTTTAAGVTTYTNTGLVTGTTYYYRVRAIGPGTNSTYTNTAGATPN